MSSCKGNCGSNSCGFGKKKKSAFGSGADAFFNKSFTNSASINSVSSCLNNGVYNKPTALSRFGSTKHGPMKIGKTKK